jgi:hypothetical protein
VGLSPDGDLDHLGMENQPMMKHIGDGLLLALPHIYRYMIYIYRLFVDALCCFFALSLIGLLVHERMLSDTFKSSTPR